jgi:membrane associated rhomboid family serine protease
MIPIRDHNPSLTTPYVTWALIVINIAVHLWVASQPNDMAVNMIYYARGMIPAEISQGLDLSTLVTGIFLHGGWLHLAGNMLFLWIFGDNLEDELGHAGFLLFYLLGGLGASLAQWVTEPWSTIPVIGASGAIAAVMGGYLLFFPKARVDIFIFLIIIIRIVPIPAWIMLGLWLALQILNGATVDTSQGGVAYWAHAGGFLVGMVLLLPAFFRRGGRAFWDRTHGAPVHPDATYGRLTPTSVPVVKRAGPGDRPWP